MGARREAALPKVPAAAGPTALEVLVMETGTGERSGNPHERVTTQTLGVPGPGHDTHSG